MRVVQISNGLRRRAGIVEDGLIRLTSASSLYELAQSALASGRSLAETVQAAATSDSLSYGEVESAASGWRLLPCIDHPLEPARCLVSGTGLTHESGALNRDSMHTDGAQLTDSMRMYRSGVERGKPAPGEFGISPEWFYKGSGTVLRAHLEPLTVPWHADDGGEEAEIAGVYLIDAEGRPRRLGMAQGNEFSDHVLERSNYLYLASSKLRECSLGPELVLDPSFDDVPGEVTILRGEDVLWSQPIRTGEAAMCHGLANIEHHHFKHAAHCRPGDLHVHFLGASSFSYGGNIRLEDGDIMSVSFAGFGRPLRNPIVREPARPSPVNVVPL